MLGYRAGINGGLYQDDALFRVRVFAEQAAPMGRSIYQKSTQTRYFRANLNIIKPLWYFPRRH